MSVSTTELRQQISRASEHCNHLEGLLKLPGPLPTLTPASGSGSRCVGGGVGMRNWNSVVLVLRVLDQLPVENPGAKESAPVLRLLG